MNVAYKQNTIQLYTLEDAEKLIDYKRQKEYSRKKSIATYYIKQKLSGFVMVAIGIITPIVLDGDATFSLIALPLGIYLIFTKSKVMNFRGK
jgi:hypothetical protein